jgi:beta-1,4-mannosyl-glycoprotein beta-1,4-N-acetylglucosaminyltransferase
MSKIFDCFLYNGENNLLKLRLNYLNSYVDYFVIVESCQTFQGKRKKFLFNNNSGVIKKFRKKIIYFKNNIFAESVDDLKKKIHNQYPTIEKNINKMNNFNKKDLVWYLDCFHREIIYEAVKKKIKDNDVILLSDCDEIPPAHLIASRKFNKNIVNVCIQKQFRYFYNTLLSRDWRGTVITNWKQAKIFGIGGLRYFSKLNKCKLIQDGGYHFSSMGPIDNILKKIGEWGHSEFNNPLIKSLMKYRYDKGMDIFFTYSHQLQILSLSNYNFDSKIIELIKNTLLIKKNSFKKIIFLDYIIFYCTKFLLLYYKAKRKFLF